MTTIAYKDYVIAYDSLTTRGDTITSWESEKKRERNGITFFISSDLSDVEEFFEAFFSKSKIAKRKLYVSCLFIRNGKLYECGVMSDNFRVWEIEVDMDKEVIAFGSGTDHALTAMDMGASAKEAVEMAIKRDCHSGGEVKTFILDFKGIIRN